MFIYDITLILSISTIRFVVIDSDYQNKQRLQLGYVGLILLGYQILFTLVLLEHLRVVRGIEGLKMIFFSHNWTESSEARDGSKESDRNDT